MRQPTLRVAGQHADTGIHCEFELVSGEKGCPTGVQTGRSCHLVVIDRIPFPRPDDPLVAARTRFAEQHGGNGFLAVSVPRAALLLAQGVGRLIRSSSDRGVVAVLDPRLATARYGEFLRASLPPFWFTTDGALVRESLRRLDQGSGRSAALS